MASPRLFTLTTVATTTPLSDQIDRLLSCFRQLRRLRAWTDHVHGGVATIEVTWSRKTNAWHPHLHVIADGSYFPHAELKSAWLKVTSDSYIVDVRKVHDAREAGRYVASYMCKHGQVSSWPYDRVREYAIAMHGRRLVQTFGSLHGAELDLAPKPDRPPDLEPVATAREINDLADDGCTAAIDARTHAHRLGYPWSLIWPRHAHTDHDPTTDDEATIRAMIATAALEVRARAMAPPTDNASSPRRTTADMFPTTAVADAQRFR